LGHPNPWTTAVAAEEASEQSTDSGNEGLEKRPPKWKMMHSKDRRKFSEREAKEREAREVGKHGQIVMATL